MPQIDILSKFTAVVGERVDAENDFEIILKDIQGHHNNSSADQGYGYDNFLDRTITDVKLNDGVLIPTAKLQAFTFTGDKFEEDAITGDKIADDTFLNEHIEWNSKGGMIIHAYSEYSPIKRMQFGRSENWLAAGDYEDSGTFLLSDANQIYADGDAEFDDTKWLPYSNFCFYNSGPITIEEKYNCNSSMEMSLGVDDVTVTYTLRRTPETTTGTTYLSTYIYGN